MAHLLVVDDETSARTTLALLLRKRGHRVLEADGVGAAAKSLTEEVFDLVVTDRAMPEMGGDQLATAIKQLAPDRPIIMLTGFGDLMDVKGEKPAGVDVVIGKPVTFDALQGAILQVVTRD